MKKRDAPPCSFAYAFDRVRGCPGMNPFDDIGSGKPSESVYSPALGLFPLCPFTSATAQIHRHVSPHGHRGNGFSGSHFDLAPHTQPARQCQAGTDSVPLSVNVAGPFRSALTSHRPPFSFDREPSVLRASDPRTIFTPTRTHSSQWLKSAFFGMEPSGLPGGGSIIS